jgi:hypothetical protein
MPAANEIISYLTDAAVRRGIDPTVARKVAESEALNVFDPNAPDRGGDEGSSFGPFQLHYAGISRNMPNAGLGDEFTRKTGLDARDPRTWKQQIDFALDYAKTHGWGSWMGAKKAGIVGMAGIKGGPGPGQQAAPVAPVAFGGKASAGGPGGGTATGEAPTVANTIPAEPTPPTPPDYSAYNAFAAEQANDPFTQLASTLAGSVAPPAANAARMAPPDDSGGIMPAPEFASAAPPPAVGRRAWDPLPEISIAPDTSQLADLFKVREDTGQARAPMTDAQGQPIIRRMRG